MKIDKKLTIVIPCKNESELIGKTLKLIDMQYFIRGTKVIIADSSDDGGLTKSVIKSCKFNHIKVKVIKGGLPSVARNSGAKLADTDFILFLDADIFIQNPYLLYRMVTKMETSNLDLGTVRIRTDSGEFNYVYSVFDLIRSVIRFSTPFAIGGFMLFQRSAFVKLGGFDTEDKFAEDYHLSSKVSPAKFFINNEIVYTTPRRFKNKGVYYMAKMLIKSWLNRKNPDFYRSDHNYWN